jgi:hypothetical protein
LRVSYARPHFILYRAFSTYVHPVFCYPDRILLFWFLASADLRAWGSVSYIPRPPQPLRSTYVLYGSTYDIY